MGKIHDALRRAEEERAALSGDRRPVPVQDLSDLVSSGSARARKAERADHVREARRSRAVLGALESGVSEEFRSLRARIQSIRREREIRSIVVTSAAPGEGKTTTAMNLALSFGLERDGLTCLVDADLRSPSVHRMLQETPEAGLVEMLEADAKLEEVLIAVPDTRLSVLPVRALPTYPSELLASRRMVELMDELHARFATVIVDAPPINGLPDVTALVDLCDATLLVIGASQVPRQEVEAALERIDSSKVLGTVFNRFEIKSTPYGYGRRNGRGR